MDLKITKEKMKAFWEYGKFRLIAAVLISIVAFNVLYIVTRPTVPAALKFDIIHGGANMDAGIKAWTDDLMGSVLTENQKEVNIEGLSLDDYDTYSAVMAVTSRLVSQDGDLFILPYRVYSALGKGDNLKNLEDPIPGDPKGESILDKLTLPDSISREECRITVTTMLDDGSEQATQEICGLNATKMYGLLEIGIVPTDCVLCVPDYKKVDYENIVRVLQWMLDNKMEYHVYTEDGQ